jgi:hypothetical protein
MLEGKPSNLVGAWAIPMRWLLVKEGQGGGPAT